MLELRLLAILAFCYISFSAISIPVEFLTLISAFLFIVFVMSMFKRFLEGHI